MHLRYSTLVVVVLYTKLTTRLRANPFLMFERLRTLRSHTNSSNVIVLISIGPSMLGVASCVCKEPQSWLEWYRCRRLSKDWLVKFEFGPSDAEVLAPQYDVQSRFNKDSANHAPPPGRGLSSNQVVSSGFLV